MNELAPWEHFDLEELEKQYSPSRWSKRDSAGEVISNHVRLSEYGTKKARATVPNDIDIPYLPKSRTKLDVYGKDLPAENYIIVYVHGGYWQELHKDLSGTSVWPLHANGVLTVVVGYTLAPEAKLQEIVEEIRASVSWACKFGRERGSKGVFLMGFSAGGHLITEVLSTTAEVDGNLDIIKGFVSLSGVFDLRPLVPTYVNEPLKLDKESAWKLSPLKKVMDLSKKFPSLRALIVAGENDSPEFKRQSIEYCEKLKENKMDAKYVQVKEVDHFSMVENLESIDDFLTQAIVKFVQNK